MVAFAAHIKSGDPFPVEWYDLPDGVFFLGEKRGFGNKLKIRQAKFITLVCSALKRLVSHGPVIMLACRQAYMDLYEFLERKDVEGIPVYQQVVVSGNPGVGKSMFLVYYLLRYVCHSASRGTCILLVHVAFGHACLHGSGLQSAQGHLPEPWLTCPEACCSSCCRQASLRNSMDHSSWVCLPHATAHASLSQQHMHAT